jgi:hypothetical protein
MCAIHFPELSQSCLFTTSLDDDKDYAIRLFGVLPAAHSKYIEDITGIEQIPKEIWNFPANEGRHSWNPQSALKSLHGLMVLSKMSKAAKEKVVSRKPPTPEQRPTIKAPPIKVSSEDQVEMKFAVSDIDAKKNDPSLPQVGKKTFSDVQRLSPFFSEWKDGNGKSEPIRPFFMPPKTGRRGSTMEKDIHLVLRELKKKPSSRMLTGSKTRDTLPPIDESSAGCLGKEKDPHFIFRTPRTSLLQSIVPSSKAESKSHDMSRKYHHHLHPHRTPPSLTDASRPNPFLSSDSDFMRLINRQNRKEPSSFRRMMLPRESPHKAIDEEDKEKLEFDLLCSMRHKENPVRRRD